MRPTFHPAESTDDVRFAQRLILQEAANGHFESALLDSRAADGLLVQLALIAERNVTVTKEPAQMSMLRLGDKTAGFSILKKTDFGFGPVNEFWMAGIASSFRGKGLGTELVDMVCDQATGQRKRLFARVAPQSTIMLSMLEKRDFCRHGETRKDYVFLERRVDRA